MDDLQVSEADWLAEHTQRASRQKTAVRATAVITPILAVLGVCISEIVGAGKWRFIVTGGVAFTLAVPMAFNAIRIMGDEQARSLRMFTALTGRLAQAVDVANQQARRRELQADRQEIRDPAGQCSGYGRG